MFAKRISYTLLSTYEKCHKRCYLQYFKEVVPYDKVNHRPFLVGIVADWLFSNWITKENYAEGWMEYKAETMYNWFEQRKKIIYRSSVDKAKLIKKLKKAARAMEDVAFNNNFPDRVIDTQQKLSFVQDGVEYFGKVDLWFPDEKLIWDLKITETSKYLDIFQLHFFAWLAENCGLEVKGLAFLSPLMKKSLQEHEWVEADRVTVERRVLEDVEKIKARNWKMNTSDCWGCPVSYYCEGDYQLEKVDKAASGGFKISLGG